MELKYLLQQDEDELFENYLSMPTMTHALDRRRFVKWALVSNHNRSGFTNNRVLALRRAGVSEEDVQWLLRYYELLGDVLDVLSQPSEG